MSVDTRKMTAQEWANVYGWEGATSSARFWLAMLALLLVGVALGVYAMPRGVLPGTSTGQAEQSALKRLEESTAQERMLRTSVQEELAQANAEGAAELRIEEMSPAYFYTVRDSDSERCVNLLTFENEGQPQTVTLAPEHPCP